MWYGPVAQLVEHGTLNPGVVGSNPTRLTTQHVVTERILNVAFARRVNKATGETELDRGTVIVPLAQRKAKELYDERQLAKIAHREERKEHWNSLSPEQKLAALDRRLGKGEGARKQRARLGAEIDAKRLAKIEAKKNPKPTQAEEPKAKAPRQRRGEKVKKGGKKNKK